VLLAQELLLVGFDLALDGGEEGDQLVLSLWQSIDNLLGVEDVEVVSFAIVYVVVVVLLVSPARPLLFFP
jgi:hypothetical protein